MKFATFEQQAAMQPAPFYGVDIEEARRNISGDVWFSSNKVSTIPDGFIIVEDKDSFLSARMENPTYSILLEPGFPDADVLVEPPYSPYELMDAGLMGAIDLNTSTNIYLVDITRDSLSDRVAFKPPVEYGSTITKGKRKKLSRNAPVF